MNMELSPSTNSNPFSIYDSNLVEETSTPLPSTNFNNPFSSHYNLSDEASPSNSPILRQKPELFEMDQFKEEEEPTAVVSEVIRDSKFWLVFLSLCVCSFLSALDLTAVSTVLPVMALEFKSNQYSWVGSAYALTSCAVIFSLSFVLSELRQQKLIFLHSSLFSVFPQLVL